MAAYKTLTYIHLTIKQFCSTTYIFPILIRDYDTTLLKLANRVKDYSRYIYKMPKRINCNSLWCSRGVSILSLWKRPLKVSTDEFGETVLDGFNPIIVEEAIKRGVQFSVRDYLTLFQSYHCGRGH